MINFIKRTPNQLLLIILLLAVGISFSIYKAATSFGPQEATPEYERAPSPAFALPESASIVDPQKINTPRLPDAAYEQIIPTSQSITKGIANDTLGVQGLIKAGLTPAEASNTLFKIQQTLTQLPGDRENTYDGNLSFDDAELDAAVVNTSYDYSSSVTGGPGGSVSLTMSYSQIDSGQWKLDSLNIAI